MLICCDNGVHKKLSISQPEPSFGLNRAVQFVRFFCELVEKLTCNAFMFCVFFCAIKVVYPILA